MTEVFRQYKRTTAVSILSALVLFAGTLAVAQSAPTEQSCPTTAILSDSHPTVSIDRPRDNVGGAGSRTAEPSIATKEPGQPEFERNKLAAPSTKQTSSADPGWQFAFAPYFYMTGISGTVGARGRTAIIDKSFGDVMNSFDFGLMGTFEARKGRFVSVNDMMWIKLSDERNTPGGLYSTAKVGVSLFSWSPEVGYQLLEGDAGTLDVVGGVRVMSVKSSLTFSSGTLEGFDVSQRKTWAAPIVGGHGVINLSPKFFLSTIFDAGGGFGTHFTGQFYGGAGYRITPRIAVIGGYRYFKNDYSDDQGFKYDTAMNGILLGAKFKF